MVEVTEDKGEVWVSNMYCSKSMTPRLHGDDSRVIYGEAVTVKPNGRRPACMK